MKGLSRFSACSAAFRFFFIDQFGVLHDGRNPYPGVIDALRRLKARGARVVVLSNSGKSGEANAARMEKIGLPRDLYDYFLTSGDAARMILRGEDSPLKLGPAMRCLTLSSSKEHDLADDLGLVSVERGEEADLVIISGSQGDRVSLAEYERRLAPAARRGVPCVCTNPDKLMLTSRGVFPGAGAIAEVYERRGGFTHWFGKPHTAIYTAAARLLGSPEPTEVLCLGDSVEHDIVGARRFGAAAMLVRTGILANLDEAELAAECARHGAMPDVVLSSLQG
jgi:HAD superfamily hydrolase (TIGR01459 family)